MDFYSNLKGGSLWEIHALILLPLTAVLFNGDEYLRCWFVFLLGVTVLPSYVITAILIAGAIKWNSIDRNTEFKLPYPSVTIFKSLMMIMTIIAILAVDFNIFDRRLAKTEDFGTSLMDIGVGIFIYSGGLMFGFRNNNSIINSIYKAFPVWILGFARLIAVKMSKYHEHVSEYGVHWNFFFTLGTVPVLANICKKLPISPGIQGYSISIVYQIILSNGLMDYMLSSDRNSLFSKNREGLLSLLGYLSIWLLAADISKQMNKSNYSFLVLKRLCLNSFCLAVSYALDVQTSRRAANFPFVVWCCSVADVFLWLLHVKSIKEPLLLKQINRNQLVLFLLANIFTGAINMLVETRNVSDISAFVVLTNYTLIITIIAKFLS